jgi:uncharacterized membrane protein
VASVHKKVISISAVFLLVAMLSYSAVLHVYPKIIMHVAMKKLSENGRTINSLAHSPRINQSRRIVVRPSPDLLYSVCVYDLSVGDLEIVMHPTSNYYSLSLYDDTTNNFYVKNDSELIGRTAKFILSRSDASNESNFINVPTDKGIAVIRRLATNENEFESYIQIRESDYCKIIN